MCQNSWVVSYVHFSMTRVIGWHERSVSAVTLLANCVLGFSYEITYTYVNNFWIGIANNICVPRRHQYLWQNDVFRIKSVWKFDFFKCSVQSSFHTIFSLWTTKNILWHHWYTNFCNESNCIMAFLCTSFITLFKECIKKNSTLQKFKSNWNSDSA